VSVICSDKTGTLTQGKMEVRKIWTGDKIFTPKDNFDSKCSELVKKLAMVSNIDIHKESNSIGNPTEMAIIKLFFDVKEKINEKYTKVHEIPFSSERKMMSVIFKDNITQKYLVLVKGAIDRLSFSNADKEKVKEVHDKFASEALRVISLGSKELDTLPENLDEIENDLKFEGMVGIIDPPRVDAKSSVNIAKRAGIRTIMITGDHAITAAAIAKEIGILEENTKIMSGKELAEISEEELSKVHCSMCYMNGFCKNELLYFRDKKHLISYLQYCFIFLKKSLFMNHTIYMNNRYDLFKIDQSYFIGFHFRIPKTICKSCFIQLINKEFLLSKLKNEISDYDESVNRGLTSPNKVTNLLKNKRKRKRRRYRK